MSRAYRISISESVQRHICVADGLATRLEILEVLPAPALCELLATELAARGFVRQGERMIRHADGDIEIVVAVGGSEAGQVTVRLRREAHLDIRVQRALERTLGELGRELDRIASRVTAEALKVRAGQLGEIQEICEDPETGSLTIRVKV